MRLKPDDLYGQD